MKKLFLAVVVVLVSFVTYAQEEKSTVEVVEATAQEVFTEIEISDLPEAVIASVTESYPTAKIAKAYVNSEAQYKLEVTLEDGTSGTLHADAEGNWINI